MESRLQLARGVLEGQLLANEQIRLIDIGRDPNTHEVVLRVHVLPGTDLGKLSIPEQVAGIRVAILFGDYRPG